MGKHGKTPGRVSEGSISGGPDWTPTRGLGCHDRCHARLQMTFLSPQVGTRRKASLRGRLVVPLEWVGTRYSKV